MEIPNLNNPAGIEEGEVRFDQALEKLLPAQREFLSLTAPYGAYVGGFGSGKTLSLCLNLILNGMVAPGGFSLVGRLHQPELKITTQKTFLEIFPLEWCKEWTPSSNPPHLRAVNGHDFIFSHLDITSAEQKAHIRSLNLSGFGVDQAEEIPFATFMTLMSRLRRQNVPNHYGRLSANPNGGDWLWETFFDQKRSWQKKQKFIGILAPTTENIHLRADYVEDMMCIYPDDWKERFIYGSFADFSGKVFKDWNSNLHGWDCDQEYQHFAGQDGKPSGHPPSHWPVIVGIDIGGGVDPWSFVFVAVQPETGYLFQFAEIHAQGILIREFADRYFEMMDIRPLEGAAYDWENQAAGIELAGEGIPVTRANKDVLSGIFKVAQYLHPDPRIESPFTGDRPAPRYYVCRNCCPSTCRSLANLSYAKDRSGNETGEIKHDEYSHDSAALRYAVHTFRPEPKKIKPRATWDNPALDPLSRQYWREVEAMKKRGYVDPHERYSEDTRKRYRSPFSFKRVRV